MTEPEYERYLRMMEGFIVHGASRLNAKVRQLLLRHQEEVLVYMRACFDRYKKLDADAGSDWPDGVELTMDAEREPMEGGKIMALPRIKVQFKTAGGVTVLGHITLHTRDE